jgi:glyoxylase-like metal-dependent hydrolase (beta-lactamase superfamily II)
LRVRAPQHGAFQNCCPSIDHPGTLARIPASGHNAGMGLQIAGHWFDFERLGDGITRIWEPHVIRVMQCNVWHVQGRDRDLIIDTGMGLGSLTRAAAEVFSKPLTAVATHTHLDHVGSLHEFSERVVHVLEADELNRPSENFSMLREDHPVQFVSALEHAGYEVGSAFITALPRDNFDLRTFARPAAPATRVVREGDVLDLGDRVLEVLHLPGHSPGSIGLWEAATGIFFSGDAIYDGPLLDELPGSDIAVYMATMRRLEALPARLVHAGHDPSFDGARLRELARAYLERRT